MTYNSKGRRSGDCYLKLQTHQDVERAIEKNGGYMYQPNQRRIEIARSSSTEMEEVLKDQGSTCFVRLRGIPYDCTHHDITVFFQGKF